MPLAAAELKRPRYIPHTVVRVGQPQERDTVDGCIGFAWRKFHAAELHQVRVERIGDLLDFCFNGRVEFFTFLKQRGVLLDRKSVV